MDRKGCLELGGVVLDPGLGAADRVVPAALVPGLDAAGRVVPVALVPGLDAADPDVDVLLLIFSVHPLAKQLCPLAVPSLSPDSSCSQKSPHLLPELPQPS